MEDLAVREGWFAGRCTGRRSSPDSLQDARPVPCSGPPPVEPAGRPPCQSTSRPASGRRRPNVASACCAPRRKTLGIVRGHEVRSSRPHAMVATRFHRWYRPASRYTFVRKVCAHSWAESGARLLARGSPFQAPCRRELVRESPRRLSGQDGMTGWRRTGGKEQNSYCDWQPSGPQAGPSVKTAAGVARSVQA